MELVLLTLCLTAKHTCMKKIIRIASITLLSVAAFSSCKKKQTASPVYSAAATINGAGFASYASSTTDGPVLAIFCTPGTNASRFPQIDLGLTTFTGATGTFMIDGTSATGRIDSSESSSVQAVSGSITILSVTPTTVSGSFNFICSDSTKVVNGSFIADRN